MEAPVKDVATALLERGDIIGIVGAVFVGVLALYLKTRAETKGGKSDASKDPIDRVLSRVQDIDQRLVRVEADVENMPTREEFHDMDKSLARLDTRVAGIERTTDQTRHAVGRIEDFMLKVAGQSR